MEADQNELEGQPEDSLETAAENQTSDSEAEPQTEAKAPGRAARRRPENAVFTINIYSWTTPVVGLLMLVIGLLAGYFGRPLLAGDQETGSSGAVTSAETPSTVAQLEPPANNADPEEVMAFLSGNVRHFKGSETAPVTIIEFSDFQ